MRTHIAPGSPNKQDTHGAHGSPLGEEEIRLTKEVYGYPSLEPFFVPDEALEHFRGARRARPRAAGATGRRSSTPTATEFPERGRRARALPVAARCPPASATTCPKKGPDAGMIATRKASQEVIQWAAAEVPELVGGSADLAPSTLTLIDGGGSVEAGEYGGRNLHFGIREHAMGAVVNGLTLIGLPRLRRRLPDLQRLHEGRDPARGDHAHPVDVRVHARLDRRGRGRPDAPADRAARDAARDAEPRRGAARRLQRDRARLAPRAAPDRPPDRARALPPGPARCGTRRRCPTTRSSAAPTCCTTRDGGEPEVILMGDRLRGPHRQRGAQAARSRRHPGTARVDAVPRPLRRAGRRPTATASCRRRSAPASPSRRPARSAGTAGSATSATSSRWRASAPPPPRRSSTSTSGSPARRSPSAPGRSSSASGARMSVTPQVNERLAALTAAGTSVWLDQIRRGMIESGELARMVDEDSPARRHLEPGDLREGDPRLARLRRRPRRGGARGPLRARGLPPPRRPRRAARRRRAAAASTSETGGADGYVSLEVAPRLAHDTDGTLEQARMYWGLVDRPEPDDQDPRHARGDPGDRDGAVRGHERQRHAAVRRRRLRGGDARVHPRDGAPPRRGPAARPPLRRLVLRLARRHRGRQAAGRARPRRTCRAAPGSPTPAPPTRPSSACSAARSSPRCARPAARSSARCGRRPASRTPPTPRRCTSTASSGPTPSTRCRCRRCRPPRATAR